MGKLLDKIFQIGFWTLLATIVATGVVITFPKYRQMQGLERKRAHLERRIAETQREIVVLKDKQRRFNTDREFVESLARESRRVYPGEIVFVFKE